MTFQGCFVILIELLGEEESLQRVGSRVTYFLEIRPFHSNFLNRDMTAIEVEKTGYTKLLQK